MRTTRRPTAASGELNHETAPFPWEAVLHIGLCRMRLDPKIFWSMTPLEFAIAAGLRGGGNGAPDRRGLEALLQAFPDGVPAHVVRP
ncbi:phage tail assembly chaperone [Rhizobium sp. ARZ01]|uniref:rcc01693 family protein n=1 Tax=Rhizobium sp. ARZ01 TaxID=2769313 RepID=UPI0017869821|nr:rcc01693 family protein [Rhizobium sp. ARZ01]MBD9371530.1 phage tail assembly chaperone [Rhizobium sp. ARZ01]